MRKLFSIIILILQGIIFQGCYSTETAESKDVKQDAIHHSYFVKYDEESGEIYAEAQFRFGGSKGTTLILSTPSRVAVNGVNLTGKDKLLRGQVYSTSSLPIEANEFIFEFTDTEEKEYVNKVRVFPCHLLNLPDTFSRYAETVLKWEGAPVQANETITVEITDNNGNSSSVSNTVKGSNSVIVKPSLISNLSGGIANIQVFRHISLPAKECGNAGGVISSSYYSAKAVIKLNPQLPAVEKQVGRDTVSI